MDLSKIFVEASKVASARNLFDSLNPMGTSERHLMSSMADLDANGKGGNGLGLRLLQSILRNNVQEVQLLLEKGADPNYILTMVKTPRPRPQADAGTRNDQLKKATSTSNVNYSHSHGKNRKKKSRSVSPFRPRQSQRRLHAHDENDGSEIGNKQQDLDDRYKYMDQVFLWKRSFGEEPTLVHVAVLNVYHRHVNGTGIGGFIMKRHEVDKALKILNLMMIFGGRATQSSSNIFLNRHMRYSSTDIMKTDNPTLRAIQKNNLRRASARRKSRNNSNEIIANISTSIQQQRRQSEQDASQQQQRQRQHRQSEQSNGSKSEGRTSTHEQEQQRLDEHQTSSDSVDDAHYGLRQIQTHAMDLALGIQRMTLWMDLDPAAEASMVQAVEMMGQHLCDPTKPIVRSHKVPFDLITFEVLEGLRDIIFNWEPVPSSAEKDGQQNGAANGNKNNKNNKVTTNQNNDDNNNNKDDHRFLSFINMTKDSNDVNRNEGKRNSKQQRQRRPEKKEKDDKQERKDQIDKNTTDANLNSKVDGDII